MCLQCVHSSLWLFHFTSLYLKLCLEWLACWVRLPSILGSIRPFLMIMWVFHLVFSILAERDLYLDELSSSSFSLSFWRKCLGRFSSWLWLLFVRHDSRGWDLQSHTGSIRSFTIMPLAEILIHFIINMPFQDQPIIRCCMNCTFLLPYLGKVASFR